MPPVIDIPIHIPCGETCFLLRGGHVMVSFNPQHEFHPFCFSLIVDQSKVPLPSNEAARIIFVTAITLRAPRVD